jgi:hypothetical protein
MTNPVFPLMAIPARRAKAAFLRRAHRVEAVQWEFLQSLLQFHAQTELGRHYNLADIRSVDVFREQVPVQPYSFFKPYIDRMADGETHILTPDPLIFFNMTSGSTSAKKLVPVTRRSRKAVSRANQVSMGFVIEAAQQRGLPLGKMLFTSPSKEYGETPSGIAYGPISTSDLRLTSWLSRLIFAYPFEVLQIADSRSRYYVCLLFALRDRHLRMLGATFPVLALQLADYLEQFSEALIHDLETGTIPDWLVLSPELRQALERQWVADGDRAAELRAIYDRDGCLMPKSVWNLSFIVTARGGTSNFYLDRFPDYYGDTPVFGGTYTCAEATFGIHRDFGTDSVFPAFESGFLEFIPEDQWDAQTPKTVLLSEVAVGSRYRIVVTNYSGFYRYDVGDVVEVEGVAHNLPHFAFRHRRGGVLSSTTEKTTEHHVSQVMQTLQREFNVTLENFCITLSQDRIPAHYQVNVELAAGSQLDDSAAFLQTFDDRLKEIHTSYAFKRRDQVPPPRLRILAPGSFEIVRQRLIQWGATESQIKFPLVSENRALLADLPIEQEVMTGEETVCL